MSTTAIRGVSAPAVLSSARDFSSFLDDRRARGASVGLVPTMGALHAGHASLIETAAAECDSVAVTIFVNPSQFDRQDDFDAYPRDTDADIALAAASGAGCVFAPGVSEMYPPGATTVVSVPSLSGILEGASRPGHFDGVATIVAKLFALAGRCRAYFGEKDFQQLVLVRRMVRDLDMPIEVLGCPTVREADGVAMSSRNRRLSAPQRAASAVVYRALCEGAALVRAGEREAAVVAAAMRATIGTEPLAELDYAVAVPEEDLRPAEYLDGNVRLLAASSFGPVRLIDNLPVTTPVSHEPGQPNGAEGSKRSRRLDRAEGLSA